jgi:hypothetical protein
LAREGGLGGDRNGMEGGRSSLGASWGKLYASQGGLGGQVSSHAIVHGSARPAGDGSTPTTTLGGGAPVAAVQSWCKRHFSPWIWKKKVVEGVEEDRIYRIWPWEAQRRGKPEGEGGRHDLAATEKNARAFFSRSVSGEDEEEQNEPAL